MSEKKSLPPGMAALWLRPDERGRPGRRPGLTLQQITAAAMALADADGLGAVSMARVAERLGVTTMAIYRYVAGKDELLALMLDTALAPPRTPVGNDLPWRDQLDDWCRAQLDLIAAHPWAVRLSALSAIGPNRVRWIEQGLAALENTPLPVELRVALIGMLSLHVFTEGQFVAAIADQQAGRDAEPHPALLDYGALLRSVVDAEQHPRVADALVRGAFDATGDEDSQEQQNLALTMLLDGVAALIARCEQVES